MRLGMMVLVGWLMIWCDMRPESDRDRFIIDRHAPSTSGAYTARGRTSVGSGERVSASRCALISSVTALQSSMPQIGQNSRRDEGQRANGSPLSRDGVILTVSAAQSPTWAQRAAELARGEPCAQLNQRPP